MENPQERQQLVIDPVKYLEKITPFDGQSEGLKNFMDGINTILPTMILYNDVSQRIFLNIIKGKLTHKARQIAEIHGHLTTWDQLRQVLHNNFSDRRNIFQLIDELRTCKFKNNVINFYNEIQNKLQILNVRTSNEYNLENQINLRNETMLANTRLALDIFKNKLPEPVRALIYARNPEDLHTAINIVGEAGYLHYSGRENYSINPKQYNNNSSNFRSYGNNNFPRNHTPNLQNTNNSGNFRHDRFANNNRNYLQQTNNSGNFRNYNSNNSRQSRNYSHQNNMSLPNNNQNYQFPEPMEVNENILTNFPILASETTKNPYPTYPI